MHREPAMPIDILTATYFEIFDIPVAFDYDVETVAQRYRDLQKTVHPDNFVSSSDQEKRISMQHTSKINEAFNTLKNPVDRALYMLKLKGLEINFDNETTMDAGFLMEQLELREALAGIGNDAQSLAALDSMDADVRDKLALLMTTFSELYESGENGEARECIRKMQFLQKACTEISDRAASIKDEMLG